MSSDLLAKAVARFGADAKAKLANPAITGAPEDQLRGPLDILVHELAAIANLPNVDLVGETTLGHLNSRPDFAVTQGHVLIGFIEVKAPGKGADPRHFSDPHDKAQWQKLQALPNLIYTDGNSFSLWRNGELQSKLVHLEGEITSAGAKLSAPSTLLPLITDFLTWAPVPPHNAKKLAEVTARLCRLLRDDVLEQIEQNNQSLFLLAKDWRNLLFPNASNAQFADGYAQAVTFGLLIARAFDISLASGIDMAALKLKKTNSLIGTALALLTDETTQKSLDTSLRTLTRVLDTVNWHTISKDKPEAWLNFYEDFLEVYDNRLRKQTGSYYTPPEVVSAMVRLVDEVLRGPLFERPLGLASADVTIADPAVGTGTFLLGVMRRIASNAEDEQGEGAVRPALLAAMKRLFGFELQFGPFAVAQLRVMAELRALIGANDNDEDLIGNVNLFITNTLDNPFVEQEQLPQVVEAVARSRRDANRIKRETKIHVVIGNPPYKEKAEGRGGWIEQGSKGHSAPLDHWKAPTKWKATSQNKLKNLYVYFWRWATLKVFGSGWSEATGKSIENKQGIICFITASGFLNGPGFQKMRDDLRRCCSHIWVIDCTPEGHQPEVKTRIFSGVQHPICIVLAVSDENNKEDQPARVRFQSLCLGTKKDKFEHINKLTLDHSGWSDCDAEWRAPFLPKNKDYWNSFPPLKSLFSYGGLGCMPGRTWVISADSETLTRRWDALIQEKDADKKSLLFHPHPNGDRTLTKATKDGLGNHEFRNFSAAVDTGPAITPARFAFRALDRQWIIPDNRLINRPNPNLWNHYSKKQIFLTALDRTSPTKGPAIIFTELIPDLDHYKGSFGGRVYPLWANAQATQSNIRKEVLDLLALTYGMPVSPDDVLAYIAGVMAHPAFTARFEADLIRPGLRLPLTADATLFSRAADLGREIIWLHCYGERFIDKEAGRPKGAPKLPKERAPKVKKAIEDAPAPLPNTMVHDPTTHQLHIGDGIISPVTKAMWDYEVSGKQVIWHWFGYRRRDRTKPMIGDRRPPSPLEKIQPASWPHEYTNDLLDLLHVLGRLIDLEPTQASLLSEICDGPLIPLERLRDAGLADECG